MTSTLFLCLILITVNGNILKQEGAKSIQTPKSCEKSKYRSLDGSCNNLKHPTWGMASRSHGNLAGFHDANGKHESAKALSGNELPEARKVSFELFSSRNVVDNNYNFIAAQYGKFITSDMDLSLHAPQTSAATSWLDLSIVYGTSEEESDALRDFECGRLKAVIRDGEEWPPQYQVDDSQGRSTDESKNVLHQGGDCVEINSTSQLPSLHVVWWREHNRVAHMLCILNPHWSEDALYQEARRITVAEYQHVTYNEYLPTILGEKYAEEVKLHFPKSKKCIADYDSNLDPSVANEYALIAAYLNSYATGFVQGQNPDILATNIQRGRDLGVASYVKVRNLSGLPVPKSFEDLINICKMSPKDVETMKSLYECVDDIDLVVGGVFEPPLPNTCCGETFLYMFSKTFICTRHADRFFYQNCKESKFDPEQLVTIQETTMSRILCFNAEIHQMQPYAFRPISKGNELESCNNHLPLRIHYWCDEEGVPIDEAVVDKIEVEVNFEEHPSGAANRLLIELDNIPMIGG